MDLARWIWFALPWPGGQGATQPERTPTLWVCADGQQDELASIAKAIGLPGEAIYFNTPRGDPYAGTEIDAPEDLERLIAAIETVKPGLVFINTLTNATALDLCRAPNSKAALAPLRDIAQETETPVIVLMHLSKEGQALGRRAIGLTRTLIHLERPNPEQPERLRLWIEKSFIKKPPALGVTISDT